MAAAQEERFTRKKHDSDMPCNAFKYCLSAADLSISDIDCIAYYEDPKKKLERQLWSGYDIEAPEISYRMAPSRPVDEIRKLLGYEGRIEILEHHFSHAASSFYYSDIDEAAILTFDGVGEWTTTTYGYCNSSKIELFEEVEFPNSIGLFYSTITSYLGFKVNDGEYKVMGLAPYGKPLYTDKLNKLVILYEDGQYRLDMSYFDFVGSGRMYSDKLIELMGQPPRIPESELTQFHKDLARSLQYVLEDLLVAKARYLAQRTKSKNLCMAGGVALNCVANGRILREGIFNRLFVQPAANDSGCALGAAAIAYSRMTGERTRKLENLYLGPEYSQDEIQKVLDATSLKYKDFRGDFNELLEHTAGILAKGKVVGWFQGRMEFGLRALGARSILADPRVSDMRNTINRMVKKREGFRPFAPAVLEDMASQHFDLGVPSPYMLFTCDVTSSINLPAITHVDNSARVQTVNEKQNERFAKLIGKFHELTGCPILLNTSFNVRGEPIVMNPLDAINCFVNSQIDCLVLGDFVIMRNENSLAFVRLILSTYRPFVASKSDNVYTFI